MKQYYTVYSDLDELGVDAKPKSNLFSIFFVNISFSNEFLIFFFSREGGGERYVPETVSKSVSRSSDYDLASEGDVSLFAPITFVFHFIDFNLLFEKIIAGPKSKKQRTVPMVWKSY